MRLRILQTGHRPLQKVILTLIKLGSEGKVPGPILVMSYRRNFVGKHLAACFQEAMRATTAWKLGEVELFAALVSSLNQCKYCIGAHTATAELGTRDRPLVAAVLADWRTAPVEEKVRRTLGFLEKLTVSPAEVTQEDIEPMRSVGVSDQAIEEAVYVCCLFNMINRLADAFDFELFSAKGFQRNGRMLYTLGYRLASVPG